MLTNRVSSFFDKVSIPYTIEHSINTQVYIIHVKNIQEYQQQIKKAYRQPLNWHDEDEITHIMETEIANRKDGGFLSAACVITPFASKEDGKYYELSSSPMYVYGEKKQIRYLYIILLELAVNLNHELLDHPKVMYLVSS